MVLRGGRGAEGACNGAELTALAGAGTVSPIRWWREGMAGWGTLRTDAQSHHSAAIGHWSRHHLLGMRKPAEAADLIELSGRRICATCKPMVLSEDSEGVPAPAAESEVIPSRVSQSRSLHQVLGVPANTGEPSCFWAGRPGRFFDGYGWIGTCRRRNDAGRPGILSTEDSFSGSGLVCDDCVPRLDRLGNPCRVRGSSGFPIGTLINGYVLYLLLSQKGRTIFTDAYRRVVTETPHVKYRTPIWN